MIDSTSERTRETMVEQYGSNMYLSVQIASASRSVAKVAKPAAKVLIEDLITAS